MEHIVEFKREDVNLCTSKIHYITEITEEFHVMWEATVNWDLMLSENDGNKNETFQEVKTFQW